VEWQSFDLPSISSIHTGLLSTCMPVNSRSSCRVLKVRSYLDIILLIIDPSWIDSKVDAAMQIKLFHITINQIDHFLTLAQAVGNNSQFNNADSENNLEETVENIIENYLLTCNSKKVELTQYLVNLNKQETSEMIALYYYFSKLTFDSSLTSNEELSLFWGTCKENADSDIARIGLGNMIDFLKERSNLAIIFSNAAMNLK
jgi:hypothetical protein